MAIRVSIFEDNKKFRQSISVLIDCTPGFALAGAFPDANHAVENVSTSQPDVVLMDIEMPGANGIDALKEVKKAFPKLNVLMQTVFEDDDKVFESICNGASGYILKNTAPARILDAIVETYQGGAPMTPVIARKVLQILQNQQQSASQPAATENYHLTARRKKCLPLWSMV